MSSDLRLKIGNVNKEHNFITVFDNFETYLKISNAHVHRCKIYNLNSASYEFLFRCSFLYVPGLFSIAILLLASYPYYEIALMTTYTSTIKSIPFS